MILLDGKKLAESMKEELKAGYAACGRKITLAIIQVGTDPASETFVDRKRKLGEELGVAVAVRTYNDDIKGSLLRKHLADCAHDKRIDGIVVQLPLPKHMRTQDILNAVPPAKDVDMLSARSVGDFSVGKSIILPPVVGAVDALFRSYDIGYVDKKIVIVGAGRLVGKPIADWFSRQGIGYCLLTDMTKDIAAYTKDADIIISGAGKPHLITADMVKDGSVIIDAGTSESGGRLVGDVDFDAVSAKASFITPVPGGIGPLTVVMIFKNLLQLAGRLSKK